MEINEILEIWPKRGYGCKDSAPRNHDNEKPFAISERNDGENFPPSDRWN
jgi:hypothetical protein